MRAAVLTDYGVPAPGEWPDPPSAGDGEQVVEVAVAGLNPIDVAKAAGDFYGGKPPLPSIAGSEGVGSVSGRRVYFDRPVAPWGAMAERTVVEATALFDVPDDLDDGVAVACGIAGIAGWLPFESVDFAPGEHVLVLGASGAVGQVAVQVARLRGAGRIVAAARSSAGRERALELGADAAVDLGALDLGERMMDAAGNRIDVVIDPLWGAPVAAAAQAASTGARLVNIGQSAGAEAMLRSADVRGKGLRVFGHSNSHATTAKRRAAYGELTRYALSGELRFAVERVPLAQVAAAFERQRLSPNVKLVIVP